MATVQLSQRPFLVLIAAIVLHVILISAQVNTRTGIPFLQVATFGAFAEVQRVTMNTVTSIRNLWTGYVDLTSVQRENEALKRELQTLQVRLQEERAFAQRTESLRQLLELRQRAGVDTQAAEVIGAGAAIDVRAFTIDKGSSDGVKKDMAVISPAGVVGRVVLPSIRASQVQLLLDRNAAAAALIERTRAQGVVMGEGGDTLMMDYVPVTADVKAGDLVVTSGIDGIYPKGFVIGTVIAVERGSGTFHRISVRPAVDFTRLEEVLVVTSPTSVKAAMQAEAQIQEKMAQPQPPVPASGSPASATNQGAGRPRNQTPGAPRALAPPATERPTNRPAPAPRPPAANATPARPPAATPSPTTPATTPAAPTNGTPREPGVRGTRE